MKQDQMTKLYEALTPAEQAAVAFTQIANTNEEELTRVMNAVQRRAYTGLDVEYMRTLDLIFGMASMWGLQHWKLKASLLSSVICLRREDNSMSMSERIACYEALERQLVAHDHALRNVCAQHGIDEEAVRRLSDAQPIERPHVEADQEYLEQVQTEMTALLNGQHVRSC